MRCQAKGNWQCRICKAVFRTKNEMYKHMHLMHQSKMYGLHGKGKPGWSKGKTHLDDNRIAYGKRINSIGMLGKHHTEATKKKLSEFALNRTTPTVCKRTEPYKCIDGSIVNLDSSYERTVAKLLDEHKIKWNRPKPLIWIDKKNVQHHYFPDFYLVDYDVYLDPKNEYCFKVQKEKIDYVKAHYSNCFFLTKEQLTWIFISQLLSSYISTGQNQVS